jgi:hypothetical protein
MHIRLILMVVAAVAVFAGCAPARPVAVSPAPAPIPRRVEPVREAVRPAPRPEQPKAEYRPAPEAEGISVIEVFAEPDRVRGGEDVELIVRYEIDTRRGRQTDVVETFEVRLDGALASMPTVTRSVGPGRYESRVRLVIPQNAPIGWYDVAAYIATDEGEDVGETEFRVR